MQVSAAASFMPSPPIEQKLTRSTVPERSAAAPDETSTRKIAALLVALQNEPNVRADVVARGRALAADRNYPPPEVIHRLAGLIVDQSNAGE